MSKQLLEEETQAPPTSLPVQEDAHRTADLPDLSARLQSRQRMIRRRKISRRDFTVLTLASMVMLMLLIVGVVFSQRPAPATSSTASTSANTAPSVAVPSHQTYNANAPAALQGSTVNVTLTVKEVMISIAPGIAYHAWTFNGTVPGPVIRVRQGQTVHFTLVNDGNMPHSIDFHAAQTPWNVNYQEVPPGKSFTFDWKANYPGVFMYHCGAPVVIYHMANGMYGAIIVDPAQGWAPAQEYVLSKASSTRPRCLMVRTRSTRIS